MPKFPLPAHLPQQEQDRITKILNTPSAVRTQDDVNFLNARSSYAQAQEIISVDSGGLILSASGNSVPADGTTGFRKGAKYFLKTTAVGSNPEYINSGDEISSKFIAH